MIFYRILLISIMMLVMPVETQGEETDKQALSSIEKIIVTAQKRVQSLKEVPLSVSVYTGEQIDKNATANLEELSFSVPNLTINESGISTNLFIRGVGSGVNLGFEQTVGTYIDGVYFGRARSARSALFDIERIEVLKGPQDSLFGKNAIAGALNITTRQPGSDFGGYVQLNTEPKFNGFGFKGAVDIPLTDEISTRFAILKHTEDGWFYNSHLKTKERKKDDFLFRNAWLWQPKEKLTVNLKAEYGKFEATGRAFTVSAFPEYLPSYQIVKAADPEFEAKFGLTKSTGSQHFMGLENTNNETFLLNLTLDLDFELGTLTSLTAYTAYDFDENADVDYLPIDFIHIFADQEHEQFSQEVRFTSHNSEKFNYILGMYYQENELTSIRFADIDGTIVGNPYSGRRHNTFIQESRNRAVFGQGSYRFNDNWQLNGGIRYSLSQKTLFKKLYIADLMSENINKDPIANYVFRSELNIIPHEFSNHSHLDGVTIDFDPVRDESHLSPSVNVQYFSDSNTMVYASIAKGFKGGGFDEDNTSGKADDEEYEDEQVIAVEMGTKMTLFDQLSVNFSLFRSEYDNLQVSTYDGVAGFNVGNAAESISQGIEIDGRWHINRQWYLTYAFAYLDAYYASYEQGQCTSQGTHCSELGFQNLTGRPLQFAPKYSGSLNIAFESELTANSLLFANLAANYSDEHEITGDLDPNLSQKAFTKIDARIQIGDIDENWYFALVGKNLTNEITTSWGNDIPLAPGGYFQHLDAPRSVELILNWRF